MSRRSCYRMWCRHSSLRDSMIPERKQPRISLWWMTQEVWTFFKAMSHWTQQTTNHTSEFPVAKMSAMQILILQVKQTIQMDLFLVFPGKELLEIKETLQDVHVASSVKEPSICVSVLVVTLVPSLVETILDVSIMRVQCILFIKIAEWLFLCVREPRGQVKCRKEKYFALESNCWNSLEWI